MFIILAIITIVLIVAVASLFFFGLKYLGTSVLTFSLSLVIFFFGVQGIKEGEIDMCLGKYVASCTTYQLKVDPGLFWVTVTVHFFMFIVLLGIGIYYFNKAKLEKEPI